LATQQKFPPALIEYQTGWYAPPDDDRPEENPAENTLDSSRLFLAYGLHGISYFPLQDSVTPAGWSVPWANQNFLWNAALDANGHPRRLADAITRNGDIINRWGPELAAMHKRADFGIILPVSASGPSPTTEADIRRISEGVQKIERLAQLAHLSCELLDAGHQPLEQLLRDPMIVLPVFDREAARAAESQPMELSPESQRTLIAYVQGGGTLVVLPKRPAGAELAELWKDAPAASAEPSAIISATWKFGAGRVIESSKDFLAWIDLKRSFDENRAQENSAWALRALGDLVTRAGIHPAVIFPGNGPRASSLVATELVSNEGTGKLGARSAGHGWLSVTNLNAQDAIVASVSVLAPSASSLSDASERIALDLNVPPRESLLLPLGVSLCLEVKVAPGCTDEVSSAGAELLSMAREGKTLELTFYSPARSNVRLRLEDQPSHVEVEDSTPETKWAPERHELSLMMSRGASPDFLRNLKVHLRYVPHVPELPHVSDRVPGWTEVAVVNAVRLPLGPMTNLGSWPPLAVIADPRTAQLTFEATTSNRDFRGDIDINVTGAYKGSVNLRIVSGQIAVDALKLKPAGPNDPDRKLAEPDEDGLLHGSIEEREGHDRKVSPIFFVPLRPDATTPYRYDLDSDGKLEWMLEDANVRLFVSPASGGRALAMVDKSTGFDLLSSVGGLRDTFSSTARRDAAAGDRTPGRDDFFNREYEASWLPDGKNTSLNLRYHAAEVVPDGAEVEKKVELAGDVATVSYHVSLSAAREGEVGPASTAKAAPSQAFIASQSLPALREPGRLTKFCWSAAAAMDAVEPSKKNDAVAEVGKQKQTRAEVSTAAPQGAAASENCQDFAPGSTVIEVPTTANHLEVRTAGRPGLAFDWDSGILTIAPKRYSALLELHSRVLKPGEEFRATLRFRVLAPE
jgi:hypothetical protein